MVLPLHVVWSRVYLLSSLALLPACGDDGGGDGGLGGGTDGWTTAGSDGGASDGASDGDSGGSDGGGSDSDGTGEPPTGAVPAAGITITDIHLNQGVEIPLATGRTFIDEPSRNAPVIGGRPALIRAFWDLDPDFEPREVEARLVLTYEDGSARTFKDVRTPSGPSNPKAFPGGFFWGVDAPDFEGNVDYHVEVVEVDGVDRGPAPGARLPETGDERMRGVTRRMLLDVVIVPTCGRPAFADWEQKIMTAYLYNTFPVNEIKVTYHEPVSGGCDEVEAAYTTMPNLRYQESSPAWRYYGGMVLGGCGGIAQYGGGSWGYQMDAPRTFGLCDWRGSFPTVDLFAHELGHVHARDHTFEDYDYPYDGCGIRPNVGFGVMEGDMPADSWGDASTPMQQLIPPSYSGCSAASWNDFMSYAYPYWVSDYTYRGAAELIWVTSEWADAAGGADVLPGVTLTGAQKPDGTVHWGATRGVGAYRQAAAEGASARFYEDGKLLGEYAVGVHWTHRDPGPNEEQTPEPIKVFTIQLPDGIEGDSFRLDLGGEVQTFPTGAWR